METAEIIATPHTPEWYAARRTGIGASQAAAACGVSSYKSPLDVYRECRGETETADNKHLRFGRFMEPSIVSMYGDQIGRDLIYPMPMCRHPEWPFMLATPDAEEDADTGVEIKTIGWRRASDVLERGIEETCPDYVIQSQQQMAVMGWARVKIVLLIEKELHVYPVERDTEMIEMIADIERDLWEKIQAGTPPPPTKPGDLSGLLKSRTIVGSVVPLTRAASDRWAEYESLGQQIKALKESQDLLKAQVLAEIGDAPAGLLSSGDRMVRRKLTDRKGYTVQATQVLDVRCVKYDGSPILLPEPAAV